ncbi:MAG: methylenetetrahydrofolate reductase [Armatimonadetes bacterium]|nr:methylenetetrahydrofolate reductase [Armatimonadota bacterium]
MKSGSNLEKLLRAGHFVVCGEMGPPQAADSASILKKCGYFKGYVDAVNLTDNQTAIVRMSSVMSSYFALQGGVEPIMQMTCRDRNRLAMQSDILGAYAAGIRNILCLTGDYQTFGNHPDARGVFDLDSTQLVQMVKKMRDEKKFLCGDEMKQEPRMFIGAAANPFAEPFEFRVMNLAKKIEAGADFIQTQPVFDIPRFEKWMNAVREEGLEKEVHIIAGVMPVRSVKALLYMKDSVPGMSIADEYINRLEQIKDKEAAMEEGVKIAVEIMTRLKETPGVAGVHIMPVMWESVTPRLVEEAGLLPRPVAAEETEGKEQGTMCDVGCRM